MSMPAPIRAPWRGVLLVSNGGQSCWKGWMVRYRRCSRRTGAHR